MALSCSDTCELLMEKLMQAGYKIDPDAEGQDDLYNALASCTILPPENKIEVVIALYRGLFHDVWAFTDGQMANKKQAEQDTEFGLERDESGRLVTESDDFVGTYIITLNQFDDTGTERSPWTGNRIS